MAYYIAKVNFETGETNKKGDPIMHKGEFLVPAESKIVIIPLGGPGSLQEDTANNTKAMAQTPKKSFSNNFFIFTLFANFVVRYTI